MVTQDRRALTDGERDLLVHVLSKASDPRVRPLLEQVRDVRVVGGIPTLLELRVERETRPAALPDGPIPLQAIVVGHSGSVEGQILVWTNSGYLSGIEFAWVTEDSPSGLPSPTMVHVAE